MAAIEVKGITKSFRANKAVDGVSFTVESGKITGFLGPNGAGKTTTLRCLLGLVRPDSGEGLVHGRPYIDIPNPLTEVGAVLEATSLHPGRRGRDHLRIVCDAAGFPLSRADEVLEEVGLSGAGGKRVGGYSMGMRQRLSLGTALLGEPKVLILDEPANGLDPEGIDWLRRFLRYQAHERGVAVLVSSHLLAEVEQTVDDVFIIAGGRGVRQGALTDLTREGESLHDAFLRLTSTRSMPLTFGKDATNT